MMENMQIARGQQGQQSPGEQAMEGLAETLRQQQGLSDEAFRDLQEQFNQDGQQGQQQKQIYLIQHCTGRASDQNQDDDSPEFLNHREFCRIPQRANPNSWLSQMTDFSWKS